MPLIRGDEELVQIDLPAEGEWVKVLPRLSRGQEVQIRQAVAKTMRVRRDPDAKASAAEMDIAAQIEAAEFATLEIVVKAWSFGVPVTPEALRQLDGASVDCIDKAIERLYARTEDEKND